MAPSQYRLRYLFQKFCNDTCTPDELRDFWTLLAGLKEDDPVKKDIWHLWDTMGAVDRREKKDWQGSLEEIHRRAAGWQDERPVIAMRTRWRMLAAACVILLLGFGVYLLKPHPSLPETAVSTSKHSLNSDVAPGRNGATLVLGNGKQVILDSAGNGLLAVQGNVKLLQRNGEIVYAPGRNEAGSDLYNTVSTARGRQYRLTLADGSRVWLNAASSIRYPAELTGKERRVQITGEVYIEVARDAKKPFIVSVNGMEIRVLGTHFNVNAYADEEDALTTVTEGSVSVSRSENSVILLSGQQARCKADGAIGVVKDADIRAALAWTTGYFSFDNTGIESVMRQLSRWYDVDVSYEGNSIPAESFWGDLPRNSTLSAILKVLERSGVRFRIDGKKIMVLKTAL
jgi:transmembrane sensor